MNNPNPAYYSILTADVRYSKELSDFEKLLFSEISALTQKDGYCTASNAWLASLYGKTKETISRCISKLKKLGFIEVVEVWNDKKEVILRKVYLLTKTSTGIDENTETLLTKTSIPIDENVKENNTRINNTSRNNTSIKRDASNTHETDLQTLQDMGVEKQLAQDWLQTRKEKRSCQSWINRTASGASGGRAWLGAVCGKLSAQRTTRFFRQLETTARQPHYANTQTW